MVDGKESGTAKTKAAKKAARKEKQVAKAKRSAKGENPILICQHGEFSEVIQMASVPMQNLQAAAVVNLVMHKMLTGDDGEQRIY